MTTEGFGINLKSNAIPAFPGVLPQRPVMIATIMRREGETGGQTHVAAFQAGLHERQRACSIVTPFDAPRWKVYPMFGIRKLIDPLSKPASVWWYNRWHGHFLEQALRVRLRSEVRCVIYAQSPSSAEAALRARTTPRQRVVMAVHFNISEADEWAGKGMIAPCGKMYHAMRARELEIIGKLDGLVFVSEFMRRELVARGLMIARIPYIVVPNFVADPGLEPRQQPEADLINIGSLEPRKNQGYLLDIIAAARRQGTALRLTLVGDGPSRAALERKARRLHVADLVRFAGFVPNAAQLMSRHRVYVHAALLENMPLTLVEAMARGVPVFAPAVGGIPEIFEDGVQGCILPLDDAAAAARYLTSWMEAPLRLAQAGEQARRRFLERFQMQGAVKRLTDFLTGLDALQSNPERAQAGMPFADGPFAAPAVRPPGPDGAGITFQ
jgi:glycosyltransferase involved in cell wall biosynthesis